MIKKIIVLILFILMAVLAFSVWQSYKNARQKKPESKNTKAEEVKVTFIEGWTAREMGEYLEKQGLIRMADFLDAQKKITASDYPFLSSKPDSADLEGFLFPDTYRLLKPKQNLSSDLGPIIIAKMLDTFGEKFSKPAQKQPSVGNKYNTYELVTLASIVEKESGGLGYSKTELDLQRQIVAGIFLNRLKAGLPLQSDATINFITKKNQASPSLIDTEIDSPYNTYKYKGLPPGPISNPSLSSLEAVFKPQQTDYYYFLHKQPSGEIVYSRTYEEHLKNKRVFLK